MLSQLQEEIIRCQKCPRLVEFRENLPKRKSYIECDYWRKPIPGYGDPHASLLIVGLAPSAHGANRTGRIFTGDASAKFLMQALFEVGLINQSTSIDAHDGLLLNDCYMTPIVKCVPPKDRPTAQEIRSCSGYLTREISLLPKLKKILALGKVAYDQLLRLYQQKGPPFSHGAETEIGPLKLYASYHPSPQNTYTKKLTHLQLISLLNKIIKN